MPRGLQRYEPTEVVVWGAWGTRGGGWGGTQASAASSRGLVASRVAALAQVLLLCPAPRAPPEPATDGSRAAGPQGSHGQRGPGAPMPLEAPRGGL